MTWTKPELRCDMCGELMDGEAPYPVLHLPLTSEDRSRIMGEIKKQIPPQVMVMFDGIAASQMIPAKWKLEICPGCLKKALPTLDFIKTNQIIQAIERRENIRKQQAAITVDDDD